jgi:hypothetical protein
MSRSFYGLYALIWRDTEISERAAKRGNTSEEANNAKPKPLSTGDSLMFVHYTIHSSVVVQILVAQATLRSR